MLTKHGVVTDTLRVKSFPFHQSIRTFIDRHERVYVIDQNRDAQLKSLLKIELNVDESQVQSIRSYNGVLITAEHISRSVLNREENASGPSLQRPRRAASPDRKIE